MRIAYFSPLPPRRSGIADYSAALLPHLAAHGELDVFLEDDATAAPDLHRHTGVRLRHWREFEPEHGRYDAVLYHIGNNEHHVYIYDLALRIPGVLMLHEFNVHYLVAHATLSRGDWEGYFREVEHSAGPEALEHARRAQRGEVQPEYDRLPMNRRLLERSRAAIVHNHYMVRLVREAGFTLPLECIPHGVAFPETDPARARVRLGLGEEPLVGAFGFLKPYKRLYSVIEAVARLRPEFPDLHLLLVGEEHPHCPLRPLVERLGLAGCVHITGFVPIEEFVDYIAACDISLSLRYPTVGESSGSLLRELALGQAVIVSDIGSFSELPDDVAIKVPAGEGDAPWLVEYMGALLRDAGLRQELGASARRWAEEHCAWPKVAARYAEFLRSTAGKQPPAVAAEPNAHGAAGNGLAGYILSWAAADQGMEDYVRLHLKRLVRTIEITPPAQGDGPRRVLEMGCYMQLTAALQRFLGYDEVRGCYYGPAGRSDNKVVYSGTGEAFSCTIDLFDAEKDVFPYPDGWFDTVLCCELIEHLYRDPMHMMSEINRVLKPGGHLVMSTPNIIGSRGVYAVLHGFHPGLFHTYVVPREGAEVDARHNREYAPRDIQALFEKSGFELTLLETGWLKEEEPVRYGGIEQFLARSGYSTALRGDIIYAVGRKVGPVRERYPVELYTAF